MMLVQGVYSVSAGLYLCLELATKKPLALLDQQPKHFIVIYQAQN